MVEPEHDHDDSDEPSLEIVRPVPIWAKALAWISLLLTVIAVFNFLTRWGPEDANLNKLEHRKQGEAFVSMLSNGVVMSVIAFGLSLASLLGVRGRRALLVLLPVSLLGILLSILVGVSLFAVLMMTGIRV